MSESLAAGQAIANTPTRLQSTLSMLGQQCARMQKRNDELGALVNRALGELPPQPTTDAAPGASPPKASAVIDQIDFGLHEIAREQDRADALLKRLRQLV